MAWLKNERPGALEVREMFCIAEQDEARLAMNVINLGEVLYSWVRERDLAAARNVIGDLRMRVQIVPADEGMVMRAAELKMLGGVSYADGFAAATALALDAELVTGDPEFRRLARREPGLRLNWIGW